MTETNKGDSNNTAIAWLVLAGLGLFGGIQLYRTRITPWITHQLARLDIDGTAPAIGTLTATDLAALTAVIAATALLAVIVRFVRRVLRHNFTS